MEYAADLEILLPSLKVTIVTNEYNEFTLSEVYE